ncbi:MAG: 6-bladed beta-propeller, partial [Elusimicrobiota bacterium]
MDSSGSVFVVDQKNHRVQKFDNSGNFLAKWGSFGSGDGQMNQPYSVAVDASGNVYVADFFNSRIQKFDSAGNFLAKWGTIGSGNGQFSSLGGIAADPSGNVYTTERGNHRVQKFDSSGNFLAKWGSQGTTEGKFDAPWGVAADASGYVYVADGSNGISKKNHRVQKFDSSGNFLAKWGDLGTFQGLLNSPRGLAVDSSGYVYVADFFNYRILKFDSNGTLAFALGSIGSTDGKFISVTGVAVDSAGNIFTTDASTRTHQVQKFGSTVLSAGPAAPTGVQFTAVTTGSLSVSWTLTGGHSYLMALSTNSDFSATVSSGTGALSQNTTSYAALSPGAYYFKVKVSTHPDTLYSSAISTALTGPPPP